MSSPKHVAIIMDGNGRWGLKNKKSRNLGHKAGLRTVEKIIASSIKNNIKYLTLYAFSTENWKRPILEIKFLLNLLELFLKEKIDELNKNGIKLKIIGNIKKFPKKIQINLKAAQKITKKNKKLQLILALNYGSKSEIVNAIKIMKSKKIKVNEASIDKLLYTNGIPNPDVLIRTGSTNRLSNFLLWQLSYSEIFFVKKMWPDFNEKDYKNIIEKFKKIKRNFGNI
ncbi:MAG: polyprenyl diphosphate synthase [Candidatus Pelagibacter sp.]